ncbi:MAG: hypothetical protein WC069_07205 [Candidatus Shapirobacteria bacterium]
MNPSLDPGEKELLQERLLVLCNAGGHFGVPEERLLFVARQFGFDTLSAAQLTTELIHLEKLGLISTLQKTLRPDRRRWSTTAAGDRHLMEHGLL